MSQTIIQKESNNNNQESIIPDEIALCIKNGLYKVALKQLERREKFIYKNREVFKGKKWLRSWMADNLLRGQKVAPRYRLVIEDILETKYEIE